MEENTWVRGIGSRKFVCGDWTLWVFDGTPSRLEVGGPGDIDVSLEEDGLECFAETSCGYEVSGECFTIPWPILAEILEFKKKGYTTV